VIALLLTSALGPEAGWRALLGCGAVPLLIAVWAWFALPESARWLADRGKIEEADRYVTLMERQARERGHVLEAPTATLEEKPRRAKRRELLQRQYGARTILLAVLWFATFFVTYGFTVWLPTLYVSVGGLPQTRSLLLTVVLGALQVAMAYVVASVIDRLGRRATFMIGFAIALIGGTFGFLTILLYHNPRWDVLFATGVILTIGIMPPTVSLYLYTNELYPTRLRGFATSSASSLSRIASIISPLIFGAMLDGHGGAGAIFAVLAVTALLGFLAIWLRGIETRGRSLEEIAT
jgi:MFS transporter, putative metabolite:H+ symporter